MALRPASGRWTAPAVSCQSFLGGSYVWLRGAADPSGADTVDHVDVDLNQPTAPGPYAATYCATSDCGTPRPMTFGVWYHPNGKVAPIYRNDASSSPCTLTLTTATATDLEGSWDCTNLGQFGGAMRLDRITGDFGCKIK